MGIKNHHPDHHVQGKIPDVGNEVDGELFFEVLRGHIIFRARAF